MMLSGSAVQVTGLGSWFISATKRLMVAWRSTTHRKTPRFSRRLASLAKNPSTALSHEQEVGVKDGKDSNVRFDPLVPDQSVVLLFVGDQEWGDPFTVNSLTSRR